MGGQRGVCWAPQGALFSACEMNQWALLVLFAIVACAEDAKDAGTLSGSAHTYIRDWATVGSSELTQTGVDVVKKKKAIVIKPLISKAAKERAKMERVHMEGSQKKRVKETIFKAKAKVAKEHNQKVVSHAKAKLVKKLAKAREKSAKYMPHKKAKESHGKAKVHAAKAKVYAKIHAMFTKIKKVKIKVRARLKKRLPIINGKYAMAKAKQKAKLAKRLLKFKAAEKKQKAAHLAHVATFQLKLRAVKQHDVAEKHAKKTVAAQFAAKLKARRAAFRAQLAKKAAREKANKAWEQKHSPGASRVRRLSRRARRHAWFTARQHARNQRRKVQRALQRLQRQSRNQERQIRTVARQAYNVLSKKHRHGRPHRRVPTRVLSTTARNARRAEFKYGAAHTAMNQAWKMIVREKHLRGD